MKRFIIIICAILLGATSFIFFFQRLTDLRQSSIRLKSQLALKKLSVAIDLYRDFYNKMPVDLEEIQSIGLLSHSSDFDQFCYVGGESGILAFRKKKFREVEKGEPWGGSGEVAKNTIPAARLILFSDGSIKYVNDFIFQKKYKSLLTVNESNKNKIVHSIRDFNLGLEELIIGMQWSLWYRKKSGYNPDRDWFGAYIILPVEDDLYLGFGTGRPSLGDGALLARFDGETIEAIGSLKEEGIHELIWDSHSRTLHIAGTDPSWPDDWSAGNHYKYDPAGPKRLHKYRNHENGLVNVIHTWGLWSSGKQELWAAVNSHDGSFMRDKNIPRKILVRIQSLFDKSLYSKNYGVTRIGQIFNSEDGGISWRLISNLGYFRAYDIIGFDDKMYAIYTDKPELPCKLARSENNGKTWHDVSQCSMQSVHLTPFKDKLTAVSHDGKSIYSVVSNKLEKHDLPLGFEIHSGYNFNLLVSSKHHLYMICTKKDGTNAIIRTPDFKTWEQVGKTGENLISLSFWPKKNWLIIGSRGSHAKILKIDLNRTFLHLSDQQ
jgi:hypothetical protein